MADRRPASRQPRDPDPSGVRRMRAARRPAAPMGGAPRRAGSDRRRPAAGAGADPAEPDDGDPRQTYTQRLFRTLINSRLKMTNRKTREVEDRVAELEARVGELSLLCVSLLHVLSESGQLDDRLLEQITLELDAADGVVDGKLDLGRAPDVLPRGYDDRDKGFEDGSAHDAWG